ncbi:FAD-dependent oxidoreductase [Pelotomaculum terephthalicicum JT]|nr:FAD-dependent oxidoreductase [Pelotomaculum terephthalicicum JT]OPX86043.1 MAG: 2,4-dienoyl-CoA reductase (NADPH) [Pelotomaculum sp. PtaB.Bin117]
MITNQGAFVDPRGDGKAYFRQIALHDDKFLPQFERIAAMFKENGAVAIQQLLHAGRYGGIDNGFCVAPSVVPQTLPHFRPPREMSKEDIRLCIKEHADAAKRAVKAGFDGVEVTSFMGYILANFLSKFTNRRADEYGGSLQNRARFMREIIYEIKNAIGDHILSVRLNGTELMDRYGGNTEEECLETMKIAAECGVDLISMCIGWQESPESSIGRDIPPGHWNYLAEQAKREIPNVPIAFGVRLPDAVMANDSLVKGQFDLWEVCRPMLADPERIIKTAEGRLNEIKPCVGCLLCLSRLFRDLPYICTVNPVLGHEVEPEYHIKPPAYEKKVIVIGGGPAGMECAIAASQRGHKVAVYEQDSQLGGQLRAYAKCDLAIKEDLEDLLSYYEVMLKKHNIEVHLGAEINAGMFRKMLHRYDVAVVATGAGVDPGNLPGREKAVTAKAVLHDEVQCGKKVAVVGGGKVGLVTAEYLATTGHEVAIIEESKRLAEDVMPTWKWRHTSWVEELNIKKITKAKVKEITDAGLLVGKDGDETLVEVDTVVLAAPRVSRQGIFQDLEYMVDELHIVGDAVAPRGLYQAIHEGYRLGVRI